MLYTINELIKLAGTVISPILCFAPPRSRGLPINEVDLPISDKTFITRIKIKYITLNGPYGEYRQMEGESLTINFVLVPWSIIH